ncbi:hypothetical protein BS78_09G141100 [Paspalum vaginatum]|nr:hypothetical protein BS78_09G141100 [Paspalum vaginatum]
MSRVTWTPNLTDFFIHALLDECQAGNRPGKTLNGIEKDNVVQRVRDHMGYDWTWDTCKNKWDELKKKWSCSKHLLSFSGVIFHPRTKLINMPKHWWDARILENNLAKVFQHSWFDHEEELNIIFKNMELVNIGPNEDGGHEGGRAGVPAHYLNSDNSNDSKDDIQIQQPTPPPQHRCSTSVTSASSRKRRSSDPMATGSPF